MFAEGTKANGLYRIQLNMGSSPEVIMAEWQTKEVWHY